MEKLENLETNYELP